MGYAAVRHLAQPTRFEDFLEAPRAAERIVADVGLDPAEHAAALDSWADRVQNTNNAKFVEAKTSRRLSRPDHARRVER
ncbi:MAG: hypothetical protein R2724_15770 [Bryobacterales bacterium]